MYLTSCEIFLQIKFSELTLDMFRFLQCVEKMPGSLESYSMKVSSSGLATEQVCMQYTSHFWSELVSASVELNLDMIMTNDRIILCRLMRVTMGEGIPTNIYCTNNLLDNSWRFLVQLIRFNFHLSLGKIYLLLIYRWKENISVSEILKNCLQSVSNVLSTE